MSQRQKIEEGLPGAGGRRMGSCCLMRAKLQVCKMIKVWEIDAGDYFTIM